MEQVRGINMGNLLTQKNREMDPPPDNFDPFRKESSTMEVLGATFSRTFIDSATPLVTRKIRRELDADTNIIQPDDLNERYPGMPQPFNEPMSLSVADSLASTQRRRKQLDDIIGNGDPDSAIQNYGGFVVSLGVHIMDPVGMAVGGVIGKGLGWVASKALARGGAGAITKTLGGLRQTKLSGQVTEGAIGGAAEELGLAQPLLNEEQQDEMTTTELALSVAAGGLFPVGLNGLGRTAKSTFNFLKGGKRGAEKVTNSLHAVEGQLENGKRVDTEDYVNAEMQKELPELEKELEAARKEADTPLPRDAVETDLADGPQKSAKKAAKKTAKKKTKKTAKKKTKKTAKKAAKVKELEERVETARNAPTPDRVESVRRHNSRESDLNYDPDIAETVKTNLDNPLLPEDITPELTRQFTELDERVSRIDIESLPEEIRIELDGARAEFNKVETVDKAFNAAENCVRSV